MPDAHKNFAFTYIVTPPSPASSGTSLGVESGAGALFPAAPFNATVWPADELPLASNAEIVRVTDVTGDTLTITRAQESSSARAILVGDQIAATITAKALQDIETDVAGKAGVTNPTLAGYVLSASRTVNRTALVGTEVDITKPETVVSLTSSPTLTFSATPAEGYEFRLTLNADSTARTVTIPACFSIARQGTISSVIVPANGTLMLAFKYTGARWEVFGDPTYGLDLGPALADGEYTGITEPATSGAALAFGELCYRSPVDSRWGKTDATSSATYNKKLGVCVTAAGTSGDPTKMLLVGRVRKDSIISGLTVGEPVYMSGTAGRVQSAAPSASGSAVRIVGHTQTANELYFNPVATTIVIS